MTEMTFVFTSKLLAISSTCSEIYTYSYIADIHPYSQQNFNQQTKKKNTARSTYTYMSEDIKPDLQKLGWEHMGWIHLAKDTHVMS